MEYFGYFADQERYEAEQELNAWYDEQEENYIMSMQEQEVIPEVIEWESQHCIMNWAKWKLDTCNYT